jgi:hypothetical protein
MQSTSSQDDTSKIGTLEVEEVIQNPDGSAEYRWNMEDETYELLVLAGVDRVIDKLELREFIPSTWDNLSMHEKCATVFFCYTFRDALMNLIEEAEQEKQHKLDL